MEEGHVRALTERGGQLMQQRQGHVEQAVEQLKQLQDAEKRSLTLTVSQLRESYRLQVEVRCSAGIAVVVFADVAVLGS